MKIQVLGTGCAKCKQLAANAEKAVAQIGLAVAVEKVEDLREIVRFGVMSTPALVLDAKVKASGRIPSTSEIVAWLTEAAAKPSA